MNEHSTPQLSCFVLIFLLRLVAAPIVAHAQTHLDVLLPQLLLLLTANYPPHFM
jgi:hypothetical protein